jgi:hypothetical protein
MERRMDVFHRPRNRFPVFDACDTVIGSGSQSRSIPSGSRMARRLIAAFAASIAVGKRI